MTLLQGEEFDNLFHTFNHTAFHLELKDPYHVPEEAGPFELFWGLTVAPLNIEAGEDLR